MPNINQKIEKYNQNLNSINETREKKRRLEANQRLYGSEVTATLTAECEQQIQRWEAENELIIQEIANLLQATRPEGELSKNQEFIHQLNQQLGGNLNLNQLFLLMNDSDRERERERERERAELENTYNRLLEQHYAKLLELEVAQHELNKEKAEKTETIGKKEQKINKLNAQLAKESQKVQALRNKLQNLRKQPAEQTPTEPQSWGSYFSEKTSNFAQQGKEWANRGINHYQQNRRAYQGAALTGLLITGGIAAQHYSEINSTNSLSIPNLDLDASFVPNCPLEVNNLKGIWESKFNDLDEKFRQKEQTLLNEKQQLEKELATWKSIFPYSYKDKPEWAKLMTSKLVHELEECRQNEYKIKEDLATANGKIANLSAEVANSDKTISQLKKDLGAETSKLQQRPTWEAYNQLKNNQKPADLPANWKSELARIGQLEGKNKEQKEQINNLKLRPASKDYQDLQSNYNSLNTTHNNYQAKYKFSEQDVKEVVAKKEQEWINKGLINPHNQSEIEKAELVKKTEYERVKAERDNRPEITDYQQLISQQKQTQTELNAWQQTFKGKNAQKVNEILTQTQKERDEAQAGLEAFNQQLDAAQQELVRSQRRERKLTAVNSNYQKQIEELKVNNATITDLATQLENKQQETTKLQAEITQQKQSKNHLQSLLNNLLGGIAGYAWNGKDITEQEVEELVEEVNNLREQPVYLNYPNDYESLKTDKDKLVQELTLVKGERDKAIAERNDYKIQGEKQEKKMVQELNESLNLNLKEPDFKQVIKRIQELISKPPITITDENTIESLKAELSEARQTAKRLEKELVGINSSAEKDLANIAETTCQMLGKILPERAYLSVREEIQQATSYQQIVQAQTKAINNYLAKNAQSLPVISQSSQELSKPYNQERVVLISLLVVSLLSVGGLLVKIGKRKGKN